MTVRLVVVDAASVGLQAGLAGYDNEGSGRVYRAGLCVDRQTHDDDLFHRVGPGCGTIFIAVFFHSDSASSKSRSCHK